MLDGPNPNPAVCLEWSPKQEPKPHRPDIVVADACHVDGYRAGLRVALTGRVTVNGRGEGGSRRGKGRGGGRGAIGLWPRSLSAAEVASVVGYQVLERVS